MNFLKLPSISIPHKILFITKCDHFYLSAFEEAIKSIMYYLKWQLIVIKHFILSFWYNLFQVTKYPQQTRESYM